MSVDPKRSQVVFLAAVEELDPDRRAAILDRECGADVALRQRVEAMLRAYDLAESDLDQPVIPNMPRDALARINPPGEGAEQTSARADDETDDHTTPPGETNEPALPPIIEGPGSRIGPYRLLQAIGEGGMGAVYMAEQERPVRRRVALKIIKPGLDSGQVIARFEAERQALALMDHPHIAKVLDAGATDTGRPYFVMELVKGIAITEYCDRNRLTPRERLELFIPVCQAIQHAHQKGIIHRDIKPSNVLVTLNDGKPLAKVIDFGVAKAIDQRLTEKTMFTQYGQIIGTLEYMSPEQAEMGTLDIDTRSDIYSLGVLLYELLTGTTPLERGRIRTAAFLEILRRIREDETPRPSTRLSDSKDALATISAQRKTEPARLTRLVRGDLDWIVMRALEKDRTRRYETATGFGRDIQRYLDGDPVEAGPPSAVYRLRKFARKHRVSLIVASAFAGLLIAAAVVSSVLAIRARRAEGETQLALDRATDGEKKARQSAVEARTVLDFFREKVLAATRPESEEGGLGKDVTVRLAVDAAEPKIADAFRDQPAAESSVRQTMGQTYLYLGEPPLAIRQLERSSRLRAETLGRDHPDTLACQCVLAEAYSDAGRLADALPLFQQTLELQRAKLGPDHPDTLKSMRGMGVVLYQASRLDEAIKIGQKALELARERLGPDHPDTLTSMQLLAVIYYRGGNRLNDALPLFEETLRLSKIRLGPEHTGTLTTMNQLGAAYLDANRPLDALPLIKKTLAVRKAKLGPSHPSTISSMANLGALYFDVGRLDDAIKLAEETVSLYRSTLGVDHAYTLISMGNLAMNYETAGRFSQAIALHEQTLAIQKTTLDPDHLDTLATMTNLGDALTLAGRPVQGLPLLLEALRRSQAKLGPEHEFTLHAQSSLADAYLESSAFDDAETLLQECLKTRQKTQPDDRRIFETRCQLAYALIGQERFADAEPLLVSGYEGIKSRQPLPARATHHLTTAGRRIIRLYEAWEKPAKAQEWRTKLGLNLHDLPSDVLAR